MEGQVQDSIDVTKSKMLPPEKLIEMSLEQLRHATDRQERIRLCLIALAVCTSMGEENPEASDYAALVWARSLQLDLRLWLEWLSTQPDLTDPALKSLAMDSTLFGALIQECRKTETLGDLVYGRHIEAAVLKKLGSDIDGNEMARLLRSITAQKESMQGKSLVVAHY